MYGRKNKYYLIVVVVVLYLFATATVSAKTWKLGDETALTEVSESVQNDFVLEMRHLKNLVDENKVDLIQSQVDKIKSTFPDLVGLDFDSFVKGEMAYAEGNFTAAVRAYDSFMRKFPHSQFLQAALEREYIIGQAYLNGHKKKVLKIFKIKGYAEGEKVMEKVIEKAGNSPLSVKALTAVAESLESRGKYDQAYERWSQISSRWPTGETGKNALLSMARCKHASYKGPEYDVSDLVSAKSYYENYSKRYPEDAGKYEIEKRLAQINEQIAYKEYSITEYYHRTGSNVSADYYCDQVLENWPDTTSATRVSKIAEQIDNAPVEKEKSPKENKWNLKNLIMP